MTINKVTVQMMIDENGHPLGIMPYNGRATIYLTKEASVDDVADLMKLMCDSEPPKLIDSEEGL